MAVCPVCLCAALSWTGNPVPHPMAAGTSFPPDFLPARISGYIYLFIYLSLLLKVLCLSFLTTSLKNKDMDKTITLSWYDFWFLFPTPVSSLVPIWSEEVLETPLLPHEVECTIGKHRFLDNDTNSMPFHSNILSVYKPGYICLKKSSVFINYSDKQI